MTPASIAAGQLTTSSVYQEYLAKTLTDKYNHLNVQMDRLVNDANSELEILNQKLSSTSHCQCRPLEIADLFRHAN